MALLLFWRSPEPARQADRLARERLEDDRGHALLAAGLRPPGMQVLPSAESLLQARISALSRLDETLKNSTIHILRNIICCCKITSTHVRNTRSGNTEEGKNPEYLEMNLRVIRVSRGSSSGNGAPRARQRGSVKQERLRGGRVRVAVRPGDLAANLDSRGTMQGKEATTCDFMFKLYRRLFQSSPRNCFEKGLAPTDIF